MKNPNYGFYAVCDGHGLYGHLVSQAVKKELPSRFIDFKYVIINSQNGKVFEIQGY